ncbi:MAG: (2Fe-2S) ferredoxin domain-containing protein [Chlorobiales bacterium]|jgi:(2Fe-2S) ferredoxin|nr:(2Fe-2S) ferredoxin domain-containing protein [Chlorobiales bacterium]
MEKPKHHILVCASFRAQGGPQGICHKKDALQLLQYMQEGLSDRGMIDVMISTTGCLNVCDRGPAMIVYPEGFWYGKIESEDMIDEILDALENGEAKEEYLLT